MRHMTSENACVQQALGLHIGDVASAAAQEALVLDALDRAADPRIRSRRLLTSHGCHRS
jgi:hypothetical protein